MRWALIGALAAVVACGAAAQRTAAPAAQDSAGAVPEGRPHEELRELDAQIAREMAELGLPPTTDDEAAELIASGQVPDVPATSVADTCETPPEGAACADVCRLADSICAAAARICDLAGQLPDDAHAARRCAAGKSSCNRAKSRCCDCGA